MGFRIEAPKQDGNARFNTLKVNLNENNSATRTVVADTDGNFYYGTGGGGGTGGTNGTSGVNGTSGTSGTGFNTISNPALGRVLLSDGSTNSAIAATNLNFSNNTLQVTGSLIADSLLINSDVFEFTGSLRVLGGITGSLFGTASWAYNALTASSADSFTIRSDKFEFTGSLEVLGGITGSLFGTSSWAISASWSPGSVQSDTASYVSSSNVYGPYGFDSIRTASFALTASSADTFVIRSDKFEFTGSLEVLGGITGSLFGTASYSPNIYNSNGTLTSDRVITANNNLLYISSSKTAGSTFVVDHIQTQPNSTDTADIAMQLSYNLTASSATNQLVTRAFQLSVTNGLTGGGSVQNLRCFNLAAFTRTGSNVSDSLDLIYLERGTVFGTVANYRAMRVANYTGTNRAGITFAAIGGTNATYLNLGSIVIPSGFWGVYQSEATYNNYFNGNVSVKTSLSNLANLQVQGNVWALSYTGSLLGTASLAATASSADTFVIRSDKFEFTGSLEVLGGITGSLLGTSSFATTASHALNVPVTSSHALVASSSVVTNTTTGTGPFYLTFVDEVSGSRPLRVDSNTLTFNATTNVLTATASNALTASSADTFVIRSDVFEFTGSVRVQGGITGSLLGTASFATTASHALNSIPPFPFSGSAVITGSLVISGSSTTYTLDATGSSRLTTLHVQNIKNPLGAGGNGSVNVFAIGNPGDTGFQVLSIFAGGSPYSTVLQTSGDGGGSRDMLLSAAGPGGQIHLGTSSTNRWYISGTFNVSGAGHFFPVGDNLYNIGDPTAKVANYYGVRSYISNLLVVSGSSVVTGSVLVTGSLRVAGNTTSNIYYTDYGASSVNLLVSGQTPQTSDRGIYIGSGTFNNASVVGVGIGSLINLGTGTGNVAIGYTAAASSGGVAIGSPSGVGATSDGGVALSGTTSNSARFAVMGSATAAGSISISSTVSQLNGIGIGVASSVSAQYAIALGDRAVVGSSHTNSIAIGLLATTTAAKQLVIGGNDGSNNYAITDVYIGGGVQDLNLSNGTSVAINASGGNGTDRNGGNITIAGGKGTGTGTPGDIILSTATSITTGTTLQSLTQRVWIKGGSGNVGVNNTSPSTLLTVGNTSGDNGGITVLADNTSNTYDVFSGQRKYPRIRLIDSIGGGSTFQIWNLGNQLRFGTNAASSTVSAVNINAGDTGSVIFNGDVGIRTSSPAYTLDVLGTIRATGDVIAYSDARVKDNVERIENALEKVISLRGVSYTRKDTDDKSRKLGVIAQELIPIIPEVVSKDQHGNYSVAYGNIVGLLIEAIKEQQQQIDELKYLLKK